MEKGEVLEIVEHPNQEKKSLTLPNKVALLIRNIPLKLAPLFTIPCSG